jgi:hypothetical protein
MSMMLEDSINLIKTRRMTAKLPMAMIRIVADANDGDDGGVHEDCEDGCHRSHSEMLNNY